MWPRVRASEALARFLRVDSLHHRRPGGTTFGGAMGETQDTSLLEEVYVCDRCPTGAYGFARPSEGRPYYKFPPTIGARGQATILFLGINPRRSDSTRNCIGR